LTWFIYKRNHKVIVSFSISSQRRFTQLGKYVF